MATMANYERLAFEVLARAVEEATKAPDMADWEAEHTAQGWYSMIARHWAEHRTAARAWLEGKDTDDEQARQLEMWCDAIDLHPDAMRRRLKEIYRQDKSQAAYDTYAKEILADVDAQRAKWRASAGEGATK